MKKKKTRGRPRSRGTICYNVSLKELVDCFGYEAVFEIGSEQITKLELQLLSNTKLDSSEIKRRMKLSHNIELKRRKEELIESRETKKFIKEFKEMIQKAIKEND